MRSRQCSLPRLRWRTTPGSSESGPKRSSASRCSVCTSSSSGSQPLGAAPALGVPPASAPVSTTASASPAASWSPGCKSRSAETVPSHGALTSVSIFMADSTTSACPAVTASPALTRTSTTLAGSGLRIATSPSVSSRSGHVDAGAVADDCVAGIAAEVLSSIAARRPALPRVPPDIPLVLVATAIPSPGSGAISASNVVRASPLRTAVWLRIWRSVSMFVGSCPMWKSANAADVRATAASRVLPLPMTLASSGS